MAESAVPSCTLRLDKNASGGRSEGSPQFVGLIADARCEEAPVLSRLVDRALVTQHHTLCGGNSICADGCSPGVTAATVTWHSGLFPFTSWRREVVRGRPLVQQTARDFAELHYVVVDAAAFAAVVFDDHVLWRMMCPERVRRQVERAERP